MCPVDSGKSSAVVVITYLARERPKTSPAPEDLMYLDFQVGPREAEKLRFDAYTADPDFGQIGRMCLPHETEISFEYNDLFWGSRVDCLEAGLVPFSFYFKESGKLLEAYIPEDKLPQLREIFHY
jgi:hypothetical protein